MSPHISRLLAVRSRYLWAMSWRLFAQMRSNVVVVALLLHATGSGLAFRQRDAGVCNTTSEGGAFVGGYYGSRLLKAPPVPSTHAQSHFLCWYSFRGVTGQRVLFEVLQVNVGRFDTDYKRCRHGHLRLWDGLRKAGSYAFPPNTICGHYGEGQIDLRKYSTGVNAEVEYVAKVTDHHQHHHHGHGQRHPGFVLSFKYINIDIETDMFPLLVTEHVKRASAAVCDWAVRTEECQNSVCDILSPGYPGVYPPYIHCQYHVFSSEPMSSLEISFKDFFTGKDRFSIYSSPDCQDEYLEIYNGDSSESPLIGRFCGPEVPDLTTSSGRVYLQLVTGPSRPPFDQRGFHASITAITKEWNLSGHLIEGTLCDWLFNRSEGSVSSPDHWLPPQTTCAYNLQSNEGFYMETLLAIYGLSPNCEDRITITEGEDLVDEICQHSLEGAQSRFQYHLEGRQITITYHTSRGQYQSRPDRGFWLSFRQIKGPRKYPVIIHLKDEAARYSVEEPAASGFAASANHVAVLLVLGISLLVLVIEGR